MKFESFLDEAMMMKDGAGKSHFYVWKMNGIFFHCWPLAFGLSYNFHTSVRFHVEK
jgi:hypothetical protein